jgi:5-methylcytosine-specific restriction endonuclease McrA
MQRDGWRCTVPGCTSYRNLHAHHVVFRSVGGSDAEENLTTLCAAHHQRGVHGGGPLRITGRAPTELRFELALETFASGDVRVVERAVA